MKTTNENLTAPISGQFRSSPFYVALGAPLLASLLSIALTWLTYRVLPETIARDLMNQINPMLLLGGGGGTLGGVVAMMKRSVDITAGKIAVQGAPKLPDTVNAGGDVNVGTAEETVSNPVESGGFKRLEFETFKGEEPENENIEVINDAVNPPQGS